MPAGPAQRRTPDYLCRAGPAQATLRGPYCTPIGGPYPAPIDTEGVVLENFTVWLDCDYSNMSPTNYGANWDVGVFVGCRQNFTARNVAVIGYFRKAAWLEDVTRGNALPELVDYDGVPFDRGTLTSGGDGARLDNCYGRGGRVGRAIVGAIPTGTGQFFDEATGLVSDGRGRWGYSDSLTVGGYFSSVDHHSKCRAFDPPLIGGILTLASLQALPDYAPAALWIDGQAGNSSGKIWTPKFIQTRLSTFEALRVRLGRVDRVNLDNVWMEGFNNGERKDTAGNLINPDDFTTKTYGEIAATSDTGRVMISGRFAKADSPPEHFYGASFSNAASDSGDSFMRTITASSFRGKAGETTELRSNGTQNIGFQIGADRAWTIFGGSKNLAPSVDNVYTLGTSTTRVARGNFGTLAIMDGVTAPTGAVTGMALIYIDAADGDLKIRFSDGTLKTILTD